MCKPGKDEQLLFNCCKAGITLLLFSLHAVQSSTMGAMVQSAQWTVQVPRVEGHTALVTGQLLRRSKTITLTGHVPCLRYSTVSVSLLVAIDLVR